MVISYWELIVNITAEMVEKAYKYLKTYAYNERYNLFIKKRVAEFEFSQCRDINNQSELCWRNRRDKLGKLSTITGVYHDQ